MKTHSKLLSPPVVLGLAAALLASSVARAVPYASCITNNAGTVSYYLNEAASNVKVILDGTTTNDFLAQSKGLHSFSLGGATTYAVVVSNSTPAGWVKTSDDSNSLLQFNLGRGITVNYHPQDARLFGRIYIANGWAATGTATNVNLHTSRTLSQGLYALNADQSDALGKGNSGVKPANVTWDTANGNDPYKIAVGKNDNNVYLNLFRGTYACTWSIDGDLGTGTQVLSGLGSNAIHFCYINSPVVTGSLAGNNMVLWAVEIEKAGHYCQIARWNIAGGPLPWNTVNDWLGWADHAPGILGVADVTTDIDLGADGKVFASCNRSDGTSTAGVRVYDTDGTSALWNSLTAGGSPDVMRMCRAIQISPDGTMLAAVRDTGEFQIIRLVNGLPDITTLITVTNNPNNAVTTATWAAKDIAWDAAGNIYTIGWTNNYGVRVYSPGGTTVTVTANDTTGANGSFTITNLLPTVTLAATQPEASENGTHGAFTLSRTGDTSAALTVNYTMSGTATNGIDYTTLSGTAVIPASAGSVDVTVAPIADLVAEPTETAILTLSSQPSYFVGSGPATVFISDGNAPILSVAASAPTMYERFGSDYATVQLTRSLGNTNIAVYVDVTNLTFGGTAVKDVDYVVLSNTFPFLMDLGMRTATISKIVSPLNNALYQGNKTIVVGLVSSADFAVTSSNTTLTILDDENPSAPLLYSNPLNDLADASHWAITYGTGDQTNFPANYSVDFGYDLTDSANTSVHGVVLPPPSGDTKALRVTCNKQSNPGAAGAVNVYYTNQAFSGDFAVRFNMNLVQGYSAITEGAIFGINHTGTQSNWWFGTGPIYGGPWGSDGIWYWVSADPGGSATGDFLGFTGNGGTNGNTGWKRIGTNYFTAFTKVFKAPDVFTAMDVANTGVPANGSPLNGYTTTNWSDVEIRQVKNVVTLAIDKTAIFSYTNTTVWTNGYLMLGYADPYGATGGTSVGTPDASVYYSNLRVVRLTGPLITSFGVNAPNVVLNFASTDGNDTAASFVLQSASVVNGTYTDVSPAATFTQAADGSFAVTYSQGTAPKFYRIRHK
jgi:hypothetical protein